MADDSPGSRTPFVQCHYQNRGANRLGAVSIRRQYEYR